MPRGNTKDGYSYGSSGNSGFFSRRRMLASLGATSTVALAGCGGDGSSDGGDGDGDGDGGNVQTTEEGEKVFTFQNGRRPPGDQNLAMEGSPKLNDQWSAPMVTPPGLNTYLQVFDDIEYQPMLFSSATMNDDGSVFEVELADGYEWWDGTPVTMQDWYYELMYYWKYEELGPGEASHDYEEIELVDDTTMRFHIEPQPTALFLSSHKNRIWYPRSFTEEWYEKMDDATTGQEGQAIQEELNQTIVSLTDDDIDQWGHGLWKPSNVADDKVEYEKVEGHPLADKNDLDKVVGLYTGGEDSTSRLQVQNELIDQSTTKGKETLDWPDRYEIHSYPNFNNYTFEFNFNHEDMANRKVRHAIAHWVATENFVQNTPNTPAGPITGISHVQGQRHIPDWENTKEQYIQHGPQRNADRANELMEEAGYTKQNDKWVNSDGDVVHVELPINGWWEDPNQNMASQLRQFGLEVNTTVLEASAYFPYIDAVEPEPDRWGIIMVRSNRSNTDHPAPNYNNGSHGMWMHKPDPDTGDPVPRMGRPLEPELPAMGELEGSTEKTLDIVELQERVNEPGISQDDLRQVTLDLSHYYNWDLPYMCAYHQFEEFAINAQDWTFPDWDNDGTPNGSTGNLPSVLHWEIQSK